MRESIKVADEVWIATALLHRKHPERDSFPVAMIVDRAAQERLTDGLRPGVQIHVYQHCVANKRPNPGNYRILYQPPEGDRRLFRTGDDYHPYRESGKTKPNPDDIPRKYHALLDWYDTEYNRKRAKR